MTLEQFLNSLQQADKLKAVQFQDTINVIDQNYNFTPCAFQNGSQHNAAGQNNGSCKILAFALLNHLTVEQTLNCFGEYYRKDVLQHPDKDDHQNIRNLITHGLKGLQFEGNALSLKSEVDR